MMLFRRIRNGLLYEPSYHFEAASGLAALLWSGGVFLSDDYVLKPCAYIMPGIGLIFGCCRLLVLRGDPIKRAALATFGIAWWMTLLIAQTNHYGIVPPEGLVAALLVGDLLTTGKFSIMAAETLKGRRHA